MPGLSQRTSHATLWSAIEILARYGVQIVATIMLARLLAPADFGLLAMLLVFTNIGGLLADAGFGTALIQRSSVSDDDETTVFWFSTCTGLAAALVLCLCSNAIANFYHQPALVALTYAIAWVLPLSALGAVPDALLTKRMNFESRARAQVIASLASGVLAVVLAWRGFGVWSLVTQSLLASALRSISLWVSCGWSPRGRFNRHSFRVLFGFGGFMLLAGLLNTVSTRLQSLTIGRLFDARSLGFYTLAQNASSAPTSFMGALLNRVGLPVFSTLANDKTRLREALRTSLTVSLFVFIPCMVGIAIAARPLVVAVYGARWQPAVPMLSLLALSGALWPLHVLNLSALSAQGRSDRFFRLEAFKNAITVLATLLAAPFGPITIAAAMLVASIAAAGINTWYSYNMLGYGLIAQLRDQLSTLILCVLSAIPAWAMLHWLPVSTLHTLLSVAAAGIVYIGASAWIRHPALLNLLDMARTLSRQRGINQRA